MNLMDLFIKIEAQDNATTKVKMATEAVKDGAKKIGKFMLGATTAIAGAGVALGKIGLSYNSQMENYTTNFRVMLGSTEKAVKKVEELKNMAAKTPFGMQDLADATQTLLAFQVPAENTNDILKMLGDVALGDKNKLAGLATVFGQVSSAGKLQGQDLMQLINQGFNPLNYIAKRTGESMEQLRERMSKGKISADEVTQAFKDATSEGGQFYNGMEEASKTLSGQLSTLKDNVIALIGKAFEPLSEKLTNEIIPRAIELVDSFDFESVKAKFDSFVETFKKFSPLIVAITAPVLTFFGALKMLEIVKTISAGFQILNMVLMANPIILIISAIAGLVAALVTLWHTNEDFRNAVIKIWTAIKNFFVETIPNAFNSVVDFCKEKVEQFKNLGRKIVDNIRTGIANAWQSLKDWFNGLWNGLFNRNVNINVNKRSSGFDGSHANGLSYVPWDGYIAQLHKGERVLTAKENRNYNSGGNSSPINIVVQSVLDGKIIGETAYRYNQNKMRAVGI